MGDIYTNPPQSRNEAILRATIDGTEYTDPPQSRIEDLLLELKEAIEEGGGSVESYEQLTNKPQINGTTLSGDKSTEDLIPIGDGLQINADGELETADAYIPTSEKGTASGVATLTEAGKVPEAQLPSYVDDAIEGYLYEGHFYADSAHTEEITGERGKIYVDLDTNRAYRWTGSTFVEIGDNNTFTANRALVSDANGKVSASSATSEEVGYLSGVTGAIQTQLNGKQNTLTFDETPTAQSTNPVTSGGIYSFVNDRVHAHIYGVKWDWSTSDSPELERTDISRYFDAPIAALSSGKGSSPFDAIYPWCNMQEIEDEEAGTLVSIPKFWYKITNTNNVYTLRIADAPVDGFHVSPAHIDRGDGKGERDVVFVGRYHCDSNYQSKGGSQPIGGITRATARTNIHALGNTIYQFDYLTMCTIRFLYLVEFANFDSQLQIGYGCSPNGAKFNMGYTDSMQYHTGTTQSTRSTYGGTQYRHIEGLWDNVVDFVDGMYYTTDSTYIIKNPSLFGESGGVSIGSKVGAGSELSGNNSVINYAISQDGIPCPIGAEANDANFTKYTCDKVTGRSNGVILLFGGAYGQNRSFGLFNEDSWQEASLTGASVGCRLIKLP